MPPTEVLVPLRWSDMDAYGHVNNVQFLRLLEDARVLGLPRWFPQGGYLLDQGIVVARHEIEYLAPMDYRSEPIAVDLWVTRIGGAAFDLGYVVRDATGPDRAAPGAADVGVTTATVYAVAETSMALYDFAAAGPRRMTRGERVALDAQRGESVPFRRRR